MQISVQTIDAITQCYCTRYKQELHFLLALTRLFALLRAGVLSNDLELIE